MRSAVTLPSGHALSLWHGDITEEAVDAIVNAANDGLVHGGGVAGAIVRKGGYVIQDESDRVGRVATGSAAITGAGSLAAKHVIHAVGPVWNGRTPEENDRLLASATIAALEIAREKCLSSVAFPAISSGIFGFPKDRCAAVMLGAVRDWANVHPDDNPCDIRFTIIDEETVRYFEQELRECFESRPAGEEGDPVP
ncbi:MAG: macro domain-containing protein [Akkermansiaceae bacterium]|nr:macro domain-containing protein [Armatimonadota bacterium]